MSSYKDLQVWQESINFCVELYKITEKFPNSETYGLVSQLRRAGVSIPSNIAEGQKRAHTPEFLHFCRVAYGSGAEIETQLLLTNKIGYLSNDEYQKLSQTLEIIMKMLNKLMLSLKSHPTINYKP